MLRIHRILPFIQVVYSLMIAASVVGQVRHTRAFARAIRRSSFLLENFPGDPDGAYRVRPARVERQVSDGLDQLLLRHAVFARLDEVRPELVWTVHRDQRGHRHETTVALRKLRTFPDVAVKYVVSQLS